MVTSLTLKKMCILEDDPSINPQHTLVELTISKRVKDTLDHLGSASKRITDSISLKYASSGSRPSKQPQS